MMAGTQLHFPSPSYQSERPDAMHAKLDQLAIPRMSHVKPSLLGIQHGIAARLPAAYGPCTHI